MAGKSKEEQLRDNWMTEINDAQKREKNFRISASKCVKIYEADKESKQPFAVLFSNTETLFPAVYNAQPIPRVERRFKDADPVGKSSAEAGTRLLKYLIEAESVDYDNYDEVIQAAVLDGIITNRGLTRFKYDAKTDEGVVSNECVYSEAVRWDKFCHGHARTWKKVPWISFEWDMSKDEIKRNFENIPISEFNFDAPSSETGDDKAGNTDKKEELTGVKLAKVYEVWDKLSRKVYFFSPSYKGCLKTVDDPLGLSGFFPVPKPLNFTRKVSTLVPTPMYEQYESQAEELNTLTVRIKHIIKALKVRGFYNKTVEGIEKVLTAEDNDLIPVENMASMPEGMGLDKTIWLMPIAELVTVVQSLYQQREACKQVIYEITGISDILRGASIASETATAQNIKNQWGTLRLKKLQKEVQRYCRDALRIMLEIAVTKFSIETIKAMTGLPFPRMEQKQQVQMQIQIAGQQAQQQALMTGQPPQPPEIPPEAQELLQTPSWEDVVAMLQDDIQRSYRIDIETNSTIDAEASQDKQDIAELLNSLSQFLNGIAPLIENGSMPFDVAKGILLAICRRYTFGSQVEDALEKMAPPQPKADPAAEAKKAEMQMKQQEMQQKGQLEQQKAQLDLRAQEAEIAQKERLAQIELQLKQAELVLKQEEMALKRQEMQLQMQIKVEQTNLDRQAMTQKAQFNEHSHGLKMKQASEKAAQQKKEPADASV